MKIVECQPLIQLCLEQFALKMQRNLKPEVVRLGKAATAIGGKRSVVFQICGADEFDYATSSISTRPITERMLLGGFRRIFSRAGDYDIRALGDSDN